MWWTSVDCERPDVMSAAPLCAQWSGVLSLAYPSSLQREAYAEARLPRNAVARLRALSDTKIVRSDDARSTTRALLLLPLFSGVRGRGVLRSSSEKIAAWQAVNTPHGRCAGSRYLAGYCAVLADAALESAVLPVRRRGFNSHRPL